MKRPTGISILAVLYVVGGVALLGMQVVFAARMGEAFQTIGVSAIVAQLGIAVLGAMGLGAGIGMWTGKRWGWWLGAFYLTYSIARNLNALIMLPGLLGDLGEPAGGSGKHYFKFGGRVIVHALVCWYFFTPKVEEYFSVAGTPRKKRLARLAVATAALTLFFAGLQAVTK